MKEHYSIVIIGGGPAGMAAALAANQAGAEDILIVERDMKLGGILNQCIHNGFGLHRFSEELTGPEYAYRDIAALADMNIEIAAGTTVLELTADKTVCMINGEGYCRISADAVILAMGCRERPRGALNTAGGRCSGVFSAGSAQKLINLGGYKVGSEVVILGSGDIGLIMARRLTLEGAHVIGVFEIMPYSNGLNRNIVQCLNDYDIPLKTSHTVTRIHGQRRLEGVTVSQVNEKLEPLAGTEQYIPCDTLLLSVGLIPENELTQSAGIKIDRATKGTEVNQYRQTSVDGVFSCGNVLHVHDLVDNVSQEGFIAGASAAKYVSGMRFSSADLSVSGQNGISYVVPQTVDTEHVDGEVKFYMRVNAVKANKKITALLNGKEIKSKKEKKFLPGEMINISLIEQDLAGAKGSLVFSVEDV